MSETFGSGEYDYRAVQGWAKWPEEWNLHDVAAVGVDRNDNVYAFHRGDHPMVVFDRNGNVLRTWGEGTFKRRARRAHGTGRHDLPDRRRRPHGAQAARSTARCCSPSAFPATPAPFMSGEPFRRCTHTALSPKGEIYVSDGYGNARVHKYTPDGKRILSWGEPRRRAGRVQPAAQHRVRRRRLGVRRRSREPPRAGVRRQRQVRDAVARPASAERHVHAAGQVSDLLRRRDRAVLRVQSRRAEPRTARDDPVERRQGDRAHRARAVGGLGPGQFISPHGLAVDSRGDLYVGEVCYTAWSSLFPDTPQAHANTQSAEVRAREWRAGEHASKGQGARERRREATLRRPGL